MCGIVGILSLLRQAGIMGFEGIRLLQNRGYDSVGLATITNGEINVSKKANANGQDCFDLIQAQLKIHQDSHVSIAHSRWATTGETSDLNAHPHLDFHNNVAVVHNGTIDNYIQLKQKIIDEHKISFLSETDSEVIAQHIGCLMHYQNQGFTEAVNNTIRQLKGHWALLIIHKGASNKLMVARKGAPLLVSGDNNSFFVASEVWAFQQYTDWYVSIEDDEILELDISLLHAFKDINRGRILKITNKEIVQMKPQVEYQSFLQQEIYEQPKCVANLYDKIIKDDKTEYLIEQGCEHLIFSACGSSLNAVNYALSLFRRTQRFQSVQAVEGSEFEESYFQKGKQTLMVVSQSGETADLKRVIEIAKLHRCPTVGIVNVEGSMIANQVKQPIYLKCGREYSVAATKSFTNSCVLLTYLASLLTQINLITQIKSLPAAIQITIEQTHNNIIQLAKVLQNKQHIFILAKGQSLSIAREAALKLKEISYIHAEAFAAGELKHGPLALIDSSKVMDTPVILIIPNDENREEMELALSEVHSRKALTIVITDNKNAIQSKSKINHCIEVESGKTLSFSSLMCLIPLQLLTMEVAQLKGLNLDKPRNLAKTVTVH